MAWPTITISAWDDLKPTFELAVKEGAYKDAYAFRGQSVAAYELLPSNLRHFRRAGLSPAAAIGLEKLTVREFRAQAHLHLSPAVLPPADDTFRWWMLMQHHRAPTRVLDWSASPYVALYFAVEEKWDDDGALWYFHIQNLSDAMRKLYGGPSVVDIATFDATYLDPKAPPRIVLRKPEFRSDRMVAQQGGFSFSSQILTNHSDTIDAALAPLLGVTPAEDIYTKIVIPKTLKQGFLHRLRSMNITAAALFPGVDGLGRSIDELIRAGT
jgi:hypothetical protein